jgi:hypothetical protein
MMNRGQDVDCVTTPPLPIRFLANCELIEVRVAELKQLFNAVGLPSLRRVTAGGNVFERRTCGRNPILSRHLH